MSVLGVDCALVTRTQAGDEEATSELAAQVRPIAQRYASRFFADPTRAEDLAQTAMMKAFARVRDVRTPEAFQGWLLRITRNECLNELARQRVAQIPISTLEDQGTALEAPAGGEDDPEESLVRVQLQSLVRQVITTLPSHYRQTLTMRALEDRSYEEISEELDVPVAVARLWYCRARKRFRQAFVAAMVARRNVPAACQAMGGDIAEMIEGTLSVADRDRVQTHLADCHVCRQTEDELRSTAFRAPNRAMLFGLGLLGIPRKLTQSAARTIKAANTGARMAFGAAGTATALAVAGAPAAVAAPLLSSSDVAVMSAHLPATGASGIATGLGERGAGIAGAGAISRGAEAGVSDGSGLLGSLDGFVSAMESFDLGSTLRLALPARLPSPHHLVRHALHGAQPVVDAVSADVQSASTPASSGGSSSSGASGGSSDQPPAAPPLNSDPGTLTPPAPAILPGH